MPPLKNQSAAKPKAAVEPLALSVKQFCRLSSLGRTNTYELIRKGKLQAKRIGGRTVIPIDAARRLLDEAPDFNE